MSGKARPEIFILHGWAVDPQNEKKWLPCMQELRDRGFSPVFLPIPGLTVPLHEVWTLDDYVTWLEQQLKGKRDVILMGHSFGGQIAIRYTRTHSRQIKQLILIDASGQIDTTAKAVLKRAIFGTLAKIAGPLKKSETARRLLYSLIRERDYQQASPQLRKTMSNVIQEDVTAEAAQITLPTLIIWGQLDVVTPLWMGEKYHRLMKNSTFEVLPTARHSPPYTHAKQLVQVVVKWLQIT